MLEDRPDIPDLLRERTPLLERDRELTALSRLAAGAESGARAVVVTGEAGIGKSRLCREFWTTLPDGWSRVEVAGYQAEPLPLFHPLLDSAIPPTAPLATAVDALRAAIENHRRGKQLLLVLEDLQWMDARTATVLASLLHGFDVPVLVVATFRTGATPPGSPVARAVASLIRESTVTELRLGSLSPAAVADLATALGAGDGDAAVLYERTGGVPFFVEELARAVGDALPWTVTEAVVERLASLPSDARDLATVLAVAGKPLPLAVVGAVVPAWERAVASLGAAGLGDVSDGLARLRHTLVGEAVEHALSDDERRTVHGRLAAALAAAEPRANDQIARHWLGAGEHELAARAQTPDPVIDHISSEEDAPDHAARSGTGTAYELLAIAAAQADDLGQALRWAETADRAYRSAGDHRRAEMFWTSEPLTAVAALRQSLSSPGSFLELAGRSRRAMQAGDRDEALALARRMQAQIQPHTPADPRRLCAEVLIEAGDIGGAEAVLDGCDQWARERGLHDELAMSRTRRAWLAFARGHAGEALALLGEAAVDAHQPDGVFQISFDPTHAFALAVCGELDEARRLAASILERDTFGIFGAVPMARVVYEDGDSEEAARLLTSVMPFVEALAEADDVAELAPILATRATIELAVGRPAEALATAARCASVDRSALSAGRSDVLVAVARAALALGDRTRAADAVDRLRDQARTVTGPGVQAAASLGEAMLDRADGRLVEAHARFEAAARAFELTPRWGDAADAWCDAAEAAAAIGTDPGPALAAATRICETKGLGRVARRVDQSPARRTAKPSAPMPAGFDALTARELDVARLVAEGLTNREIGARLYLSTGTVRNYVSTTFAKLAITRRVELVRIFTALGEAAHPPTTI